MNNDDVELRNLLRTWQVSVEPDPGFEAAVWRRIAVEDERALQRRWSHAICEWLTVQLPRPAFASALFMAAIVIGVSAGAVRADHEAEQLRVSAARRYFSSIDPLATPVAAPVRSP